MREKWPRQYHCGRKRLAGAQSTILTHTEIENDLGVAGPISAVGKDEHCFDFDLAIVAFDRVLELLLGQLPEWGGVFVILYDISRSDDVFEPIALGNGATFLAFTTDNKDGMVLLGHIPHRCVATDELSRRHF